MYKIVIVTISFISGLLLLFSILGERHSDRILVVGTNAEFPPYCFIQNGEIVGFDIDVAKEVCHRLDKEISLKDMPFDALIPELALGTVDFVAAGMSPTVERAKRVLFTQPYVIGDPLVIVTMAKPLTLEELVGKTVVVNEGYTSDLFLSKKEGMHLVRLANPADAFLALDSGRADAFVTAKSSFESFLRQNPNSQYVISKIDDTDQECALAVSKLHPDLLVHIQKALDAMETDGTIEKFKKTWMLP